MTGAPVADGFVATASDPDGGELRVVLPAAGEPGVRVAATWDALGMRASASHDLVVEGARVPADACLGPRDPGPDVRFQPNGIFALGFAATSVGIATAATGSLRDALARRSGGDPSALSRAARHRLADAETEVAAARALLESAARAVADEGEAATAIVNAAKLFTNRAAVSVVDTVMQGMIGGAAYLRPHPVERLYRDARAGLLMRNTEDQCREEIARAALGVRG